MLNNYRRNRMALSRWSNGFSLIELMIAITIGFLVILAVIAVYLNVSQSNAEMAKTNSQIENGRSAILLLENDVIHAGFWGGYSPQFENLSISIAPSDIPTAVPDPCLAYASWNSTYINNLIGIPVQGYDDVPANCSSVLVDKQPNTDILVVRHVETCIPGVGACETEIAGKLYFQSSFCENELSPASPATPAYFVLAQKPSGTDSTFVLKQKGCTGTPPTTVGTLAEKRKFVSTIYYVRTWARVAGDGIPTLMRSRFDLSGGALAHQDSEPLIEGIEGFRVEFGVDNLSDDGTNVIVNADATKLYSAAIKWSADLTSASNRGDGSPDIFVRCPSADRAADTSPPSTSPAATVCTKDQLANVVAVKVYLLARAELPSTGYLDDKTYVLGSTSSGPSLGPFNDKFKRHVFSSTIRLVNPSGRRETP